MPGAVSSRYYKMQFTNKNMRKGILDALGTVQGQLEITILSGLQL